MHKILICSAANRVIVAAALSALQLEGVDIGSVSVELTTKADNTGPVNWFGGMGLYPNAMIVALMGVPECEIYDTDGELSTFLAVLASHGPTLYRYAGEPMPE